MGGLRKFMQDNPMAGWVVAALLMFATAFVLWNQFSSQSETEELTAMVTIRCTETGETWQVTRGVMEKELYLRKFPVDPNEGLINPKTGKPTGFPVDAWKETVERVNTERGSEERGGNASAQPPKP